MMKTKFLLLLLMSALLFTACSKRNVQDYYYPFDKLDKPQVYEYRSPNPDSSMQPYYVLLQTHVTDTAKYLIRTRFDASYQQVNLTREMIVSDGVLLQDLQLFPFDPKTGKQVSFPAKVEAGNVFPFYIRDTTGIFLSRMSWNVPSDSVHVQTLIRNRRFLRDTTFLFKDRTYQAVVFEIRELSDDDNSKGHLEVEVNGIEVYARELGLVYYRLKTLDGRLLQEYQLVNATDYEIFKKEKESE